MRRIINNKTKFTIFMTPLAIGLMFTLPDYSIAEETIAPTESILPLPPGIENNANNVNDMPMNITPPNMLEEDKTDDPLSWNSDEDFTQEKTVQDTDTINSPDTDAPIPDFIPVETPVKDDATVKLTERVEAIEKDILALKEKLENLLKPTKEKDKTAKTNKPAESNVETAPTKKTTIKKKIAKAQKSAVPAPKWNLKSARRGTAMVSEKGSSELRTISVGETLPGLGEVISIEQGSDGRWVVKGTSGAINQ